MLLAIALLSSPVGLALQPTAGPLSKTCLRMFVRLAELRGFLTPGTWQDRENEMPTELVEKLLSQVLSPQERQELQEGVRQAEAGDFAGSHPAHKVLSNLLDRTPAKALSEFNDEEAKYLDDIEMSRLMARARAGDQAARDRIGELLPPVLRRKAARQLFFLQTQDQEEIADQLLFAIVRGNFSFSMEKVQTDDSNRALASYLTTALRNTFLLWKKKQEADGKRAITATDLEGATDMSPTEVLDNSRTALGASPRGGNLAAANAELQRLHDQVLPLLPTREAAALRLKLQNPNATLEQIAAATGANSTEAARILLERSMAYAREVEDLFGNTSDGAHLSAFTAGWSDAERNAFALISLAGKSTQQVAETTNVRPTSVRPSYLSAVGKMEAAARAKHGENLGTFWDRILSTSGHHADVLNSLVEYSLQLGRLPKPGEFPDHLLGIGWSEEQVYGTNNFRPQPGRPMNSLFYSRSHVNWLICREIERRKPFMRSSERSSEYQAFDPFEAQLAPRQEPYLGAFVAGLESFREGKRQKVMEAFVQKFITTGEVLDITDDLPKAVGIARRRLLSEGADFSPNGRLAGTGVFDSKSDFQTRLAQYVKEVETKLDHKYAQAVGVGTKQRIETVRQKVRELAQLTAHNQVNLVELPSDFRSAHPFISAQFSGLHPLEQNILALRWGGRQTIETTAKQLGLSTRQVVQEELLALRKLRDKAMDSGQELTLGREVALVGTSLPSLVAENLYETWKADPEGFEFENAWSHSQKYLADHWPELPPSLQTGVFRGKDHAVWALREKIQQKLRYLSPDDKLRSLHQNVVERGNGVAQTGRAATRNPYRGHLAAQQQTASEPETEAKKPAPARGPKQAKPDTPTESPQQALLREAATAWGTTKQPLLKALEQLNPNVIQRAIIRGKWINGLSNAQILELLPKKFQSAQKLIDAETSLLYSLQRLAETGGKTAEIGAGVSSLPTLQQEIARYVLQKLKQGSELEPAINQFYSENSVTRPAARAWKLRPFVNQTHRDLVLVQVAQESGDTEMVKKLLSPYKPGGSLTGSTPTAYRTELMRLARQQQW